MIFFTPHVLGCLNQAHKISLSPSALLDTKSTITQKLRIAQEKLVNSKIRFKTLRIF